MLLLAHGVNMSTVCAYVKFPWTATKCSVYLLEGRSAGLIFSLLDIWAVFKSELQFLWPSLSVVWGDRWTSKKRKQHHSCTCSSVFRQTCDLFQQTNGWLFYISSSSSSTQSVVGTWQQASFRKWRTQWKYEVTIVCACAKNRYSLLTWVSVDEVSLVSKTKMKLDTRSFHV